MSELDPSNRQTCIMELSYKSLLNNFGKKLYLRCVTGSNYTCECSHKYVSLIMPLYKMGIALLTLIDVLHHNTSPEIIFTYCGRDTLSLFEIYFY